MIQRTFILKKELFTVPQGTIFHTTYDNVEVYPYFTDEEHARNKHYIYKFLLKDVLKSPDWFEEVTEHRTFVRELRGQYRFKLPSYMNLQNNMQDKEVKKDGIVVGYITNFDNVTGDATIEILPEQAESIWKEMVVPYIGVSSRSESPTVEKIDEVLHDYFNSEQKTPVSTFVKDDDFFSLDIDGDDDSFIPSPLPSPKLKPNDDSEELDFNFDSDELNELNKRYSMSDDDFDKLLEEYKNKYKNK